MSPNWKICRRLSCSAKDIGGTVAGYGGRSMTGHEASKKRRKRAIKKEKNNKKENFV